jgi:YggT family protein
LNNLQALLLHAVDIFFYLLEMLILVRILLSWIVGYQGGSVMRLLYNLTEPILQPVRNMVDKSPLGGGVGLDFSPVFALILLRLVKALLMALIQMV